MYAPWIWASIAALMGILLPYGIFKEGVVRNAASFLAAVLFAYIGYLLCVVPTSYILGALLIAAGFASIILSGILNSEFQKWLGDNLKKADSPAQHADDEAGADAT